MTHQTQTTIEDFPEQTKPDGIELSGNSSHDSKVKLYLQYNPDFKFSEFALIKEKQINTIIKHWETPEEHQVALMQYIQNAKEQVNSEQYKFEERVIDYSEEFYPKFCKVNLSSDQINDIRLRWNDINKSKDEEEFPNLSIIEEFKDGLASCTGHFYNDAIVCDTCLQTIWQSISKLDFYLLERFNDSLTVIGSRQKDGDFEIAFDDDFENQTGKPFYEHICELCREPCMTDDGLEIHERIPVVRVTLNPTFQDKLPETIRGQKYLSSDNIPNCIAGTKVLNKAQKLIAKEKLIQKTLIENGWTAEMISQLDLIPLSVLEDVETNKWIYNNPLKVFSNGFGKDSITEIVLNHALYDQIIFADTGSEQVETYEFIDKFVSQLDKVTRHKIRIVHSRYGVIYDYYNKRPNPMTPSFTQRDCTEKFKIEPIKQWIKGKYGLNPMAFRGQEILDENGSVSSNPDYDSEVRGSKKSMYHHKIEMGLGINYAEAWRKHDGNVWYIKNQFPLIDKKITKEEEPMIIKALGYDTPIKSGCFFCFFGNKNYWLKLRREHSDHYALAVKFYEDAKAGSKARADGGGMKLELVKFPTDEEFSEYMKKFPSCGDGEVALGCECMTGNMQSGMDRNREMPDDQEEMSTKKPMGGY